jgi:hypothetical protein
MHGRLRNIQADLALECRIQVEPCMGMQPCPRATFETAQAQYIAALRMHVSLNLEVGEEDGV